MTEILQYTFFQNALIGSLLVSVLCGIIGTYIVARRLVFISGGITHASFGGIGIGVFLGINPIFTAMFFAVISALGVQWFSQRSKVREDSAIAVFWTLGMSIGIILCFLTPGFMPDMNSFLFGSILAISKMDLYILGGLSLILTIIFKFLYTTILSISFDRTFARSQRLPVDIIEYLMMALIALSIVAALRMVGIVLALSLLTIPQMTANVFSNNFFRIIIYSIIVGWIDCLFGLIISVWLNIPSGASIIFISILIYILTKTIKKITVKYA